MKRVRDTANSSLDLFLDTISNLFGGIVFLAILVSVLVQMRSKQPATPTNAEAPVTADEYREITSKLDELTSLRARLMSTVAQLQLMQGTAEDQQVLQEQERLNKQRRELKQALDNQSEAAKKLAEQLEENAQIVQDLETLQQQLVEAQAALQQEEAALEEAMADNMQVFKPPRVQTSFKAGIILLMKYGRIFPLHLPNSKATFDEHVTTTSVPEGLSVSPKATAGWDLANADQRGLAVEYLRSHAGSIYFANIAIWSDSFDRFPEFRELLIDLGLEYQLRVFDSGASVVVSKSSELPRVQ